MAQMKRERMSSVDTAWLRMDRPSNLMVICGVLVLHERIALEGREPAFAREPADGALK